MAKTLNNAEATRITIQRLNRKHLVITVQSLEGSTYISHRKSASVAETIVSKQTGNAPPNPGLRDLDAEYESCFYYTADEKYGIIADAFMGALMFTATSPHLKGITGADVKRCIKVLGEVYELRYKKVNRRVDYPPIGRNRSPDVRHRPEFVDWECDIYIQYDANQMGPELIYNLVEQAGFNSGVGDWRPSAPKNPGTHGMFQVKREESSQ